MEPLARPSLWTHLKRALGWNLARVSLATSERQALEAAGVSVAAAQHYAAWRRSLLAVALVPTVAVLGLAILDALDGGMAGLLPLGIAVEAAWFAATAGLVLSCVRGVAAWTRPGAAARLLVLSWAASLLFPLLYALLPAEILFEADAAARAAAAGAPPERMDALLELAFDLVLSGGAVLMLLPSVISIFPGAVNACLRVKSLVPAAQLPGWLLVCSAPVFLLFWLVLLVLANQALRSPLLVLGVLLWAGSPLWYAVRGRVFVRSGLGADDIPRVARAKRVVTVLAVAGIALALTAALTTRVADLPLLGSDEEGALATRIAELAETSDEVAIEDVDEALETATSFVYALDLSSWQLLIDLLAKLLLTTAALAHLVLRATLASWRGERALREQGDAPRLDADASAVSEALAGPVPP
jgi:hypothetical protein